MLFIHIIFFCSYLLLFFFYLFVLFSPFVQNSTIEYGELILLRGRDSYQLKYAVSMLRAMYSYFYSKVICLYVWIHKMNACIYFCWWAFLFVDDCIVLCVCVCVLIELNVELLHNSWESNWKMKLFGNKTEVIANENHLCTCAQFCLSHCSSSRIWAKHIRRINNIHLFLIVLNFKHSLSCILLP